MSYDPYMYQCMDMACGAKVMDHYEFQEHVGQVHYKHSDKEHIFAHKCSKCKESFVTTIAAAQHVSMETGHSFSTSRIKIMEKKAALDRLQKLIMNLRVASLEEFQKRHGIKQAHKSSPPKALPTASSRPRQNRSRSRAAQERTTQVPPRDPIRTSRHTTPSYARAPVYGRLANEQSHEVPTERIRRHISPARTAPRSRSVTRSEPRSPTLENLPLYPDAQPCFDASDILFTYKALVGLRENEVALVGQPGRTQSQSKVNSRAPSREPPGNHREGRGPTPDRYIMKGMMHPNAPPIINILGQFGDPEKKVKTPRATTRSPSRSRRSTSRGASSAAPRSRGRSPKRPHGPTPVSNSIRSPPQKSRPLPHPIPEQSPAKARQEHESQRKRTVTESEETSSKKARPEHGPTHRTPTISSPPVPKPSTQNKGTVRQREEGSNWDVQNIFKSCAPFQQNDVPGFGAETPFYLPETPGNPAPPVRVPAPHHAPSPSHQRIPCPTQPPPRAAVPGHRPTTNFTDPSNTPTNAFFKNIAQ